MSDVSEEANSEDIEEMRQYGMGSPEIRTFVENYDAEKGNGMNDQEIKAMAHALVINGYGTTRVDRDASHVLADFRKAFNHE